MFISKVDSIKCNITTFINFSDLSRNALSAKNTSLSLFSDVVGFTPNSLGIFSRTLIASRGTFSSCLGTKCCHADMEKWRYDVVRVEVLTYKFDCLSCYCIPRDCKTNFLLFWQSGSPQLAICMASELLRQTSRSIRVHAISKLRLKGLPTKKSGPPGS